MSSVDPRNPRPVERKPKLEPPLPTHEEEPTMLIEGSAVEEARQGPGYSVRPRGATEALEDDVPGVTEEIGMGEVQDVVVLLDEDPTSGGSGGDPDLLQTNPMNPDIGDGLATEVLQVQQLPNLERVEDVTSMISEADTSVLRAPTQSPTFQVPLEPVAMPDRSSRRGPWMGLAALIAIGCAVYFGGEQLGWKWGRGGTEVAHRPGVAAPGPRGTTVENGTAVKPAAGSTGEAGNLAPFRTWVTGALAAHLGMPPDQRP